MKLLTLNTHSLAEPDWENKLKKFAKLIVRERPEVFALQEVNQTQSQAIAEGVEETGFFPCSPAPGGDGAEGGGPEQRQERCGTWIRKDNYALLLAGRLKEMGAFYHWTWVPAKLGYDIYEEGLALFSSAPIQRARQCFISQGREFSNWKTRKMLGIQVGGNWYYSVHMGWWEDEEEPFASQWDRAVQWIRETNQPGRPDLEEIWVMGDFNSPAGKPNEGWDYVKASGWWDTYELAEQKDGGTTVPGRIDGWKDPDLKGIRIDYIWCSRKERITSSQVICNGSRDPVVSDHYGVMAVKDSRRK